MKLELQSPLGLAIAAMLAIAITTGAAVHLAYNMGKRAGIAQQSEMFMRGAMQ